MEQKQLENLLKDMTLEEKIDQLLQVNSGYYEEEGMLTGPENICGFTEQQIENAGSVLGGVGAESLRKIQENYMHKQPHHIPLLFMADIINGYRTVFPIPLAQGCSFNTEISKKAAEIAAKESASAGLHLTFSPMVDLVRDARWGRVMESTGEDTYLNSCFAKAIVEGYQGTGPLTEKGRIAACVKHFAGYGAPMAGRDYNTVELSDRTLREDYLPAYQAAIGAGCTSVMTSFNTLNRIPSSANKKLLREVLRTEMGFKGIIISDWASIEELISHGIAKDKKEAAKLAIEAGVDIDMMTTCYCNNLGNLVEEKTIDEALINEAVMRVLQLKNSLGLFENPFKDGDTEEEQKIVLCKEHREAARAAAVESMVLLKKDEILPLKNEGQKVAYIGPHVNSQWISGGWSFFADIEDTVTLEMGVKNRNLSEVTFAQGCGIVDNDNGLEEFREILKMEENSKNADALIEEALENARNADVVVMALGEHPFQSGEASSYADLNLPEIQMELFRKVYEVNQNIVVVLFNGRPLTIRELSEKAKAILEVWLPGTEGGNAIADVLYGDENPSGKLSMSFPYSVGQVPVFYNEFHTGRPYTGKEGKFYSKYLDIPNEPLYPFGYGLSYTEFDISPVIISRNTLDKNIVDKNTLDENSSIEASVTVKNTGPVPGKEVIQLYLQDIKGSVVRPVRELKGFQKIELQPGEQRKITFLITEEMLRFYGIDMNFASEPGEFLLFIGNSSQTQNHCKFILN